MVGATRFAYYILPWRGFLAEVTRSAYYSMRNREYEAIATRLAYYIRPMLGILANGITPA